MEYFAAFTVTHLRTNFCLTSQVMCGLTECSFIFYKGLTISRKEQFLSKHTVDIHFHSKLKKTQ